MVSAHSAANVSDPLPSGRAAGQPVLPPKSERIMKACDGNANMKLYTVCKRPLSLNARISVKNSQIGFAR